MKLRVILGKENVEKYQGINDIDIDIIYDDDDLIVQSDLSQSFYEIGPNKKIYFFGRVVGIKTNNIELTRVSGKSDFNEIFTAIDIEGIDNVVNNIEGRFIFVYIDNNKVSIGTDALGQIDLYYEKYNDGAILSSELDLLPFKDNSKIEYDQTGVAHALYVYGYRPAKKHTLYSKVKRVGLHELAEWKNGAFDILKVKNELCDSYEYSDDSHNTYTKLFLDAIEKRSSVNGNIVYLSSGWDSTSILAALVKLHGAGKVRAVIGRMHFSKQTGICNPYEISRAQQIADYFGVKLEIVEFNYYKRGPELTKRYAHLMKSQMATSMAFYQWIELAEYVASTSNGEAVFSGEISDGAHNFGFSQMLTVLDHPVHEFREYSDKMASYMFSPTFLKSIWGGDYKSDSVFNFLKDRYKGGIFDKVANNKIGKTKQLLSSLFLRDSRFPFWSLANSRLFTKTGREFYSYEMQKSYIDPIVKDITDKNLYAAYIDLYGSFHWNGGTVSTMAMTGDLLNININLPFRDSRILKFLSTMPESWGRGLEMRPTKSPLKYMLKNKIDYPYHMQTGPHSYLYDSDPDFDHAAEWNYRSAFNSQYKDIMSKRWYRNILSEEYFDMAYLDKIATNYINGREVLEEKHDLENLIYFSITGFYGQS